MALAESTPADTDRFENTDLFNTTDARAEVNNQLPADWDVTEYDPRSEIETITATFTRTDGATITVDYSVVPADDVDGAAGEHAVVHKVDAILSQARNEQVVATEEGFDAAAALSVAVSYAEDHGEAALCDRAELRRRLFLYLGHLYGEDVEATQRQCAGPGHEMAPIDYLEDRMGLPVADYDDLQEAVRLLAKSVHTNRISEYGWLSELTTEDDRVVALENNLGEVVNRAPDATIEDFRETRLSDAEAFQQAVLLELTEVFGDRFEEGLEEWDRDTADVIEDVTADVIEDVAADVDPAELYSEAGVREVAVGLGKVVAHRLVEATE